MYAVRALLGAACVLTMTAAPVSSGAGGDPKAGEAVYSRCAACHALAYDRTGPRHCGLFGRRAGAVPGFDYSEAMKRSRIVWSVATLDRFLADPLRTIPGTAMGYAGIKDQQERGDLIAYLKQAGESPACAPQGPPMEGGKQ